MQSRARKLLSFPLGLFVLLVLLAAGQGVTAPLAFSQEGGTVDAVVTVDGVCLTLSSNSIDYGTQSFSTSLGGNSIANQPGPTLTNCGNSNLDIAVNGTDASDGNLLNWTLSDTNSGTSAVCPALNTYGHFISDLGLTEVDLGLLPEAFLAGVAPAAGVPTDASLVLPCSGSDGAGQQFAFSIVYTATGAGGGGGVDNDEDGFETPLDCNDNDSSIHPGAVDTSNDGIDSDCDGFESCDDGDPSTADTWDSGSQVCEHTQVVTLISFYTGPPGTQDVGVCKAGLVDEFGNVWEAEVTPSQEVSDGLDNDCDGQTDEDIDADQDGFTIPLDCDDTDASVNPIAAEVPGDGKDNDCDGQVDET